MAASLSPALLALAWAAKNAAADGNRTLAYGTAVVERLAPPYRRVTRRNGVVVCSATQSDPMTLGVGQINVPSTGIVIDYIAAADRTTGTWTHAIEQYTDPSFAINVDVSSSGGTDTLELSANLTSGGQLRHNAIPITLPPFDTAGTSAYPDATDPRCIVYFDAQLPLASQPAAMPNGYGGALWPQFNNSWFVGAPEAPPASGNRMSQVPEAGYTNNGILQFVRTADDANASKKAFRHRIAPPIDLFAGDTVRSAYLTPDFQPYQVELWIAFAIRFWGWPSKTVTFFDVHDNREIVGPYGRASPHFQSPIQCWLEPTGKYSWSVAGCYIPGYTAAMTEQHIQPDGGLISASSSTKSSWHLFALNYKLGRSLADGPFAKVYRAIGTAGAVELLHDISGVPIGYYDTPLDRTFGKLGEYQWDVTQGSGSSKPCSDYTIETKGLFMFRAGAGSVPLSGASLIAMLRSKL